MGNGEERHVLDVRVVLGLVGDDVVHIVASLPPSQTQSSDPVGNNDADCGVDVEIVRDAHVAGIMGCEDKLLPEAPEEES